MIGQIRGELKERLDQQLLIDVSGIGYEVDVPASVLLSGLVVGEPVTLHTHFVVREDAHILFGFLDRTARDLFRSLIKVNKVGPRLALGILSSLDVGAFVACVRAGDVKTLNAVPGVGRVMAERLIMEMRDRLDDFDAAEMPVIAANTKAISVSVLDEVESALVGLGFRPQEIALTLSQLDPPIDNIEDVLRRALKLLS